MYSLPFDIPTNNFRIKSGAPLLRNLTEFLFLKPDTTLYILRIPFVNYGDETCTTIQVTCDISIIFLQFRKSVSNNGNTNKISIHAQKGSKTYSSTLQWNRILSPLQYFLCLQSDEVHKLAFQFCFLDRAFSMMKTK